MQRIRLRFLTASMLLGTFVGCNETATTESNDISAGETPDLYRGRGGRHQASNFERDTDGWTMVGDSRGATGIAGTYQLIPDYSTSDGNPGGAIFAVDEGRGFAFFFQAPPKFIGNQRRNYGGHLEFDLKVSAGGVVFSTADVLLAGAGLTLAIDLLPAPTTTWTTYRVALDESANWRIANPFSGPPATRAEIRSVLRDLSVLQIRGEHAGGFDTGYLDNVRIERGHR